MMSDDEPDGVSGDLSPEAALAGEIRRLRKEAGLSQYQLANLVGYSRAYVSRAERPGRGLASADLVGAIDRELRAGGALTARHATADRARVARRSAGDTAIGPAGSTIQAATSGGDLDELVASADESTAMLEWMEAENVGVLTVENMLGELHRVTIAYLTEPIIPLFRRVEAVRSRGVQLLRGHQRPRRTRQLFTAVGWSTAVLAWMSNDLGEPALADTHLRSAWCCAEFADNNELRAWVRATQHTVAFWRRDYASAALYAADGLRHSAPGTSRLFLSSALSIDLAKQGDRVGAIAALDEARRQAESADPAADLLAGPFSCAHSRAASGLWSDAYLEIEQPRMALSVIAEGMTRTPNEAGRRNLGSERMSLCQVVRAQLLLGDHDAALDSMTAVFETPPGLRPTPLVERVRQIGATANAGSIRGHPTDNMITATRDFVSESTS